MLLSEKTRKEINMNYRLIAIAKDTHGVIQYAVIECESSVAVAVLRASYGACFDVKFLEATPMSMKWILDFIKDQEQKGML